MKKGFFWVLMMMLSLVTLGIGFSGQAYGLQPDLIVSELLVQSDAGAGFKIFISDVTRNKGTGDTLSASITNYYIKPVGYPGKILLGRRYVPELAPNTANMGGNYLAIPAKDVLTGKGWPVPGDYYILAVSDALKYIAEISETNNQRKAPIRILDPSSP